jgi:hypothetical protein
MSTKASFAKPAASIQEGHRWWLFAACVLVSLTNEVSTAFTNLSLGPDAPRPDASSAVMQMAVTLGKLMLGAFMLAGGVAGDVYGRRRVRARRPWHGGCILTRSGRADGWNAPGCARP